MKVVQFPQNLALDPEGKRKEGRRGEREGGGGGRKEGGGRSRFWSEAYDSVLLKFQIPDRALLLKDQLGQGHLRYCEIG